MIELHPEILSKNGRREFAVLPYEEFEAITELLADYEDLRDLRAAKSEESESFHHDLGRCPTAVWFEVKEKLRFA